VRFGDDFVVGFGRRDDAERFQRELGERLARFALELNATKTRLTEFGRYASERRSKRGLGKPETFGFLGFTHICAKTKTGRFKLKRVTQKKRMRAKLREVKAEDAATHAPARPRSGALAAECPARALRVL
jgi:RNA-directed DNA polymerase